jgi:D-alanyl-D-alanine carboxypeptidase (penicillin-binding protein 5/6)
MLWFFEGCNGVKTGYTDVAGRCLVTGARRHGLQLITVVLDSVYMWNDSLALLKYGFEQVRAVPVVRKGEIVGTVEVSGGSKAEVSVIAAGELNMAQMNGSHTGIEKKIVLPDSVDAPVKEGERLGRMVIYHDGLETSSVDLLAARSIDKRSLWDRFCVWLASLWEGIVR